MKRVLLMSIVLMGCLQVALAQHTIASIRKTYQEVKAGIAEMSDEFPVEGYPPVYYHLHVAENLPGTGPHHENIRMYYNEVYTEEEMIYPPHYLRFVTSKYNFAAREFYEEYLYDEKGRVMFIYVRTPDVDFPKMHEFRLYYDGQRLLRLNVKVAENLETSGDTPISTADFKDIYTGTTVPKQYAEFCSQYLARARGNLEMFKAIDNNTYI